MRLLAHALNVLPLFFIVPVWILLTEIPPSVMIFFCILVFASWPSTRFQSLQRTEFDGNTAIQSHELPANRPGDVHNTKLCGDNGRAYDVMALTLPKTIDALPSATVAFCFNLRTPA